VPAQRKKKCRERQGVVDRTTRARGKEKKPKRTSKPVGPPVDRDRINTVKYQARGRRRKRTGLKA